MTVFCSLAFSLLKSLHNDELFLLLNESFLEIRMYCDQRRDNRTWFWAKVHNRELHALKSDTNLRALCGKVLISWFEFWWSSFRPELDYWIISLGKYRFFTLSSLSINWHIHKNVKTTTSIILHKFMTWHRKTYYSINNVPPSINICLLG